jgi:pyridoxamine 5'-phosphate oxidase
MQDPFERFQELLARAKREEANDATAMSLATADGQGRPSVRMVLLKGADQRGFAFFTNYASRKARELEARPYAALCLHWPTLRVQVRVEGAVEVLPAAESDAYFATRQRLSQVGAWASRQSQALPGRAWLLARVLRYTVRFAGRAVPRPEHWGGYRLIPDRIEFWFDQVHRLHDRLLYERVDGAWRMRRLYP